jgi:hypothetical protein
VVPRYTVDGTSGSGTGTLTVSAGQTVVLSTVQGGSFEILRPDGSTVTGALDLGGVSASQAGLYIFTTADGCSATLALTVDPVTACPLSGTACDDGDPNTGNDVEDGNCNCSGTPLGGSTTVCVSVTNGSDDVEQYNASGSMYMASSDLELISDPDIGGDQTVGIRFGNLGIPQGATIQSAYLKFTVDEVSTGPSSIVIRGQAADNAGAFAATSNNVSTRATTTASVTWAPPAWNAEGVSGADQTTPSLAAVVQEIVNRPGFAPGSSMVFILTGSGRRTAEAYEGAPASAAQLCITYSTGSTSKEGISGTFKALENLVISDNTTVTKVLDNNIMIFPNPTSGIVQINMGNYMGTPVELSVFNSVQQSVLKKRFAGDHRAEEEIDLTGLSNGQYYFIFTGAPGKVVKTVILAN